MRVTIWDLDYYYAKIKRNCYNVDAMKISSYHKQRGDTVTFVLNEYDIHRPYDLYYIIKEKNNTPNPPFEFYINPNIRWWGKANMVRINWEMDRVMLGCKPDYLLYPEKNTIEERSEYIQLFDNNAKLLPITQDYSNSFKNKRAIVVDKNMWKASESDILKAFTILADVKNLGFQEPIDLSVILQSKPIYDAFLSFTFSKRSFMKFAPIDFNLVNQAIDFIILMKYANKYIPMGNIIVKCNNTKHWDNYLSASSDFNKMKQAIIEGKHRGIKIVAAPLEHRLDTPYYHLFEELNKWTSLQENISWFKYLLRSHPDCDINLPKTWDDGFRDLVRQTYIDKEFFLLKWKDKYDSMNEVPWKILDEEFKYGI